MSSYRDDTQETVVISDQSLGLMRIVTTEFVAISSALLFAVTALYADTVLASDEIADRSYQIIQESIGITDGVTGLKNHQVLIAEKAVASSAAFSKVKARSSVADQVLIADSVTDVARSTVSDLVLASDTTSGIVQSRQLIVEKAKPRDLFTGFAKKQNQVYEVATLGDSASDAVRALTVEKITVLDATTGKLTRKVLATDSAKVADSAISKTIKRSEVLDIVLAADTVIDTVSSATKESVRIADEVIQQRRSGSAIVERMVAIDQVFGGASESILDSLVAVDQFKSVNKAGSLTLDVLSFSDELQQQQTFRQAVAEQIEVIASLQDKLRARGVAHDMAFIDDLVVDSGWSGEAAGVAGAAWSANMESWAISRYQEYQFDQLVVINGVIHGVNTSGVYRMDADQPVIARIATARVDLGNGALVHPLGAYLEYELAGANKSLQIGVTTTQDGSSQTYNYVMQAEQASHLTNGRVVFGRGLRGRHFAFNIRISGNYGCLNALSIDLAATKRRV